MIIIDRSYAIFIPPNGSDNQRHLQGSSSSPVGLGAGRQKNIIIREYGKARPSGGKTGQVRGRSEGGELTRRAGDASEAVPRVLPAQIPRGPVWRQRPKKHN